MKFAWRLYHGTYQLIAYVLETAYEHISHFTSIIVIPVSKQVWESIKGIDYIGIIQQVVQFCYQQLNRLQNSSLVKYLTSYGTIDELTFNVPHNIDDNNIDIFRYSIYHETQTYYPIDSLTPRKMMIVPQFHNLSLYKGHAYSFTISILPNEKVCVYE